MTRPKPGREQRRLEWPAHLATGEMSRSSARFMFLCVAADLCPAMLTDLVSAPEEDAAALDAWAVRWHLCAPWCVEQARHTRREHVAGSIDVGKHGWAEAVDVPGGWTRAGVRPDDTIILATPDGEQVRRATEHDRVLAAAELDPPALTHKSPEIFEWLARYQCNEEGWSEIAAHVGAFPPGVMQACQSLAAFINLPLRKTRRGRPRRA